MCVFVPNVYRPKWAHGKKKCFLHAWLQATVVRFQSQGGLTSQLLYLYPGPQGPKMKWKVTKRKKRRGEEVGFVSWPSVHIIISNVFCPGKKLKRDLNLVARFSLMGPLSGLGPGGVHSNFLVSDSFFLLVFFMSCSFSRNNFIFLPLRTQLPWSFKHLKNPTSTKM